MDSKSGEDQNNSSDKSRSSDGQKDSKICSICLTEVSNRSLPDTCDHEFCFDCIRIWSERHNQCPICRRTYACVRHNIVSDEKYDSLQVAEPQNTDDLVHFFLVYLRVIGLRNRMQRRRDQLTRELERIRSSRSVITRSVSSDVRRRSDEIRAMDEDIIRFNQVLSSDEPSIEELTNVTVGREDEINELQVADVIDEVQQLEVHLNGPLEVPNLEQNAVDNSEDSANDADDEMDSEDDAESERPAKRRRMDSSDSDRSD